MKGKKFVFPKKNGGAFACQKISAGSGTAMEGRNIFNDGETSGTYNGAIAPPWGEIKWRKEGTLWTSKSGDGLLVCLR